MPVPALNQDDHIAGPPDAPLELIMYGDFQCPYCTAAQSIVARVRKRLDGRLRFAFRHLPLHEVHPDAQRAAEASEAAAAQGKFWEMHDLLYENQRDLADLDLSGLALRAGVEIYRFDADLGSERFSRRVAADLESGQASGVTGTPTFFINGVRYVGEKDYASLRDAIKAAL